MVIFLLIFSSTLHAQDQGCISLKEGKFRIQSNEFGVTNITRTKNIQREEIPKEGVIMLFDIDWIDDCTYTLKPKKMLKGDPKFLIKDLVITVKIKNLSKSSYIAETTMNLIDLVQNFKVEIIK